MKLTFSMDPWYNDKFCDLRMNGIDALYWKCHALMDYLSEKFVHDEGKDFLVKQQLKVIKETLKIAKESNAELKCVEQREDVVEITLSFPSCKDEDAFIEQNSKQAPVITFIGIPLSKEVVLTGGRSLVEASAHFFYYCSKEKSPDVKEEFQNAWRVVRSAQTSPRNMLVYSSYDEDNKELEMVVLFENADAYKEFINNTGYLNVS